jgi:hypothetical protein
MKQDFETASEPDWVIASTRAALLAPLLWKNGRTENAIPLVWRFQAYRSIRHPWARSSVWLRRALLAAALEVLCEEARRTLNVGPLDVRFQRDLPARCDLLLSRCIKVQRDSS